MKRQMLTRLIWITVGSFVVVGCSSSHGYARRHQPAVVTPAGDVVVPNPPPPARHEVIPAPPASSYMWVPGYWTYENQRWLWIPGHWQAPQSRIQESTAIG